MLVVFMCARDLWRLLPHPQMTNVSKLQLHEVVYSIRYVPFNLNKISQESKFLNFSLISYLFHVNACGNYKISLNT